MWTEFLGEYGMFLAKLGTLALFLLGAAVFAFLFYMRARSAGDERLEVRKLNEKYEHMQLVLRSAILPRKAFKQAVKELKQKHKAAQKGAARPERRIFVLRFDGDLRASGVASLREEITALLTVAAPGDEVLVVLESAGGTVHGYGLAASQLQRIRDRSVRLTAAVDKVAASGGYMMACVADRIIAAPFAVIGSIGVLAQMPNFNRFLKKHEIDFEEMTAGKYKRTLSLFGENTDEDRAKLREELDETHELFKTFVREHRAKVEIDRIATGEHWYGRKALELGLVDELRTSDDYLGAAAQDADIYEVAFVRKKTLWERLFPPAIN
ncbi:MAG: protease SohB [Gammaproteobacteria bacterium]|nr:protease SohB [Gammaproteobacteria bacterium]